MVKKRMISKLLVLGVCASMGAGITAVNPVNVFANTVAAESYEATSDWGNVNNNWECINNAVTINKVVFAKTSDTTAAVAGIEDDLTYLNSSNIPASITVNGKVYAVDSIAAHACKSVGNVGDSGSHIKQLTTVSIPNTIKSIGAWAFSNDVNITKFEFEKDSPITTLPDGIFALCANLKTLTLPDGLKVIRGFAFNGCQSLGELKLPYGMEVLYPYAFCCMVKGSQVDGTSDFEAGVDKFNLTIPDTLQGIGVNCMTISKNKIFVTVRGVAEKTPGGTNLTDLRNTIVSGSGVTDVADEPRVTVEEIERPTDY